MANGLGFLKNPVFIGAATGVAAYIIVEEVFDDFFENIFDAVKGKKKKGRGRQKGGRDKQGGKKMIRNHFGEFELVDDYDDLADDYYY